MKSAAFGGILLGMIEGVGILLTRVTAPPPAPVPMMDMPGPNPSGSMPDQTLGSAPPESPFPQEQEEKSGGSSWFSWFSKDEPSSPEQGSNAPTETLITDDSAFSQPLMPDFQKQ